MTYKINDYIKDYPGDEEAKSELRKNLASYFECGFAFPVSNGTVAIEIPLKALNIPRGSCVIVPDISFIATATAIANCGLVPIYADVSEEYFGITLKSIKEKLNDEVKAVIVVHLGGFVNREIFAIRDFCKQNNIYLIEDCAQAFSSSASGKKVGTIGDAGTYSLQTSKLIQSGEGGFILTDDKDLSIKFEMLSNWGYSPTYQMFDHHIPSSNFRLSAVQSYLVLKQLSMVEKIIEERLKRVSELEEACSSMNIETKMPGGGDSFFDCPFFLPVKSKEKINTIEPRAEYPMRKSNIVRSILGRFYPDLIKRYNEYNSDSGNVWSSDRLLQNIDFINISQKKSLSATEILNPYRG
ncbi:MAG TPA: aminotransferase class I/II-fold pyridoxal phosphate-dependent enzyme [Clostridia bacterium]